MNKSRKTNRIGVQRKKWSMLTVKVTSILLLKSMFYQKLLGHYNIFVNDEGPSTSCQMVEETKLIPKLV